MLGKTRAIFREYPGQFWLIMAATFIDLLGGFLIFPFFSLYFTEKFGVPLTQAGLVYAIWALAGLGAQFLGGAITDRIGRKNMIIFGLVSSALSSLALALVTDFFFVYLTAAIGGLFSRIGGPARLAMVSDLLPEDNLTDGFAIWRVVSNLANVIAPGIGGWLAGISFVSIFFVDAVTSILTAVFVGIYLKESRSAAAAEKTDRQPMSQVFMGYLRVLEDGQLLALIAIAGLVGLVYWQWFFSVPVFMRDVHGLPPHYYGSLMSISGLIIVLLQLPLTRRLRPYSPWLLLAIGTFLYAVGFGAFAIISGYTLFLLAFVFITFGEMISDPTREALVARLAPEDMRGRYWAVASLAFTIPYMIGPTLGGYVLDHSEPHTLWYLAGLLGLLGAAAYFFVYTRRSHGRSARPGLTQD
jgi:MFS family permease